MRLVFSIIFLMLAAGYLASFWLTMPEWLAPLKSYAEALLIAFAILSLSILAIQHVVTKVYSRGKELTSEALADLSRAHLFITRIVIFIVAIGFPMFIYYNLKVAWGISDAVIVAIPTMLLAMVIAEQNIYTYMTARVEKAGKEKARIIPIFEMVKNILAETSPNEMPEISLLDDLSERFSRLEDATGEPNFAMYAARSHMELKRLRKEGVSEEIQCFLQDVQSKLQEFSGQ